MVGLCSLFCHSVCVGECQKQRVRLPVMATEDTDSCTEWWDKWRRGREGLEVQQLVTDVIDICLQCFSQSGISEISEYVFSGTN